jgi:protein-arginine kinase activator protein McsA
MENMNTVSGYAKLVNENCSYNKGSGYYNPNNIGYSSRNAWDSCCECDEKFAKITCHHCGFGICKRKSCGYTFSGSNNTNSVICKTCYDEIDRQLIPVDFSKLDLLKKKIEQKVEQQISERAKINVDKE